MRLLGYLFFSVFSDESIKLQPETLPFARKQFPVFK